MLSLNCRGFNIGVETYLTKLLQNVDIMFLQETWLSDCTRYRPRLENISDEFILYHSSAMEEKLCDNFMTGRTFGGTAVLIRKSLSMKCRQVFTDNPRITSKYLACDGNADVVISSAYMPWCDRSVNHY